MYKIMILALILFFQASHAVPRSHFGSEGGGGGDARTAEKAALKEAIRAVSMITLFSGLYANKTKVKNPRVAKIFETFFAFSHDVTDKRFETTAIGKDIQATRLRILEKGACPDHALNPHDASQSFGEICFSLERLTNVSSDAVFSQILSLQAHEYAHHMGFGEKDANLLQDFILRNGRDIYLSNDLYVLRSSLDQLESLLNAVAWREDGTVVEMCHVMAAMYGFSDIVSTILSYKRNTPIGAWGEQFQSSQESVWHSMYIQEVFYKTSGQCVGWIKERKDDQEIIKKMKVYIERDIRPVLKKIIKEVDQKAVWN